MAPEEMDLLLQALRERLALRPEILEAYLFGSSARGRAQAHSDVDVAVRVEPTCLAAAPFGYPAELATDLARSVDKTVDVVVLNGAPPLLYHRVLRDGVRLFARDLAATTGREGAALSRYCDYLPQLKKIDSVHAARIARGAFGR
jgi:predicted nucleotidyltransferase